MSTTTGPDLTPAVRAVEALMDDTCTITRNVDGATGPIDQDTGLPVDPTPPGPIYSGKCSLRMSAAGVSQSVAIPLSAPELEPGDLVTITSARRDPHMVGKEFVIREALYGTMSVSRKAMLVDPDPGAPE